jgi:hypothetical protein
MQPRRVPLPRLEARQSCRCRPAMASLKTGRLEMPLKRGDVEPTAGTWGVDFEVVRPDGDVVSCQSMVRWRSTGPGRRSRGLFPPVPSTA